MDNQNPPATANQEREEAIRLHLDTALKLLRQQAEIDGHSLKGRATKVAITQLEIASMCSVRSFFATEEYTPTLKLQPAS